MADEQKFADEILSDDQLDNVAGGYASQSNYDKSLFQLLGVKGGNLVNNFANYNIAFAENKNGDNSYSLMGVHLTQDQAHDSVKWQSEGFTNISFTKNPSGAIVEIVFQSDNTKNNHIYKSIVL